MSSIALLKIDRHPSAPPQPYITSITSTKPTTRPSLSHTGRVKKSLSCITCSASNTVASGSIDSGFGVITLDTAVSASDSSFAITRLITSLKDKIPMSLPPSTISAAFRLSAIFSAASKTEFLGLTTVDGLPAKTLRNEGEVFSPSACAISGPSRACNAATFVPALPWRLTTCLRASCAALSLLCSACSSLLIASFKHFPMSRSPQT